MTWRQFVMDLEALPPDAVEALFARHGAEAVTFSDGGDDAVLEPERGETPLWLETQVTGLFPADADFTALVADLGQAFGLREPPRHRIEELADREWEREWLRDFRPMRFGRRLWVCPHGEAADDPDGVVVALDPGLAFGTGTHPTTAPIATTELAPSFSAAIPRMPEPQPKSSTVRPSRSMSISPRW